jgi:protein TonB
MALRKKKRSPIILISVLAHLGLAAVIAVIPPQKLREVVAIALAETSKRDEPKPTPPPRNEVPKSNRPARAYNAAARAPASPTLPQTAQVGAASFKDIGIALDASSVDGLAIPIVAVEKKRAEFSSVAPKKPKVLVSKRLEEVCTEELVKPVPEVVVRPEYTDAAREARIEGKVRVELLVDESGYVSSARVVNGLGYGLDDAALAAVKKMRFRPGTRCAKPLVTPFVMAVRFLLGS